jgi:chromosome segregation ATPase
MPDGTLPPDVNVGLPWSNIPVPDPSLLTTAERVRAMVEAERLFDARLDVLRERLDGIDKATTLLATAVDKTPNEIERVMTGLRELAWERFDSIALQFAERDTRQERESRDNKVAVDAAFAAQKEAAAKQDESNEKSITKSERATNETISQLAELVRQSVAGIGDKIDDLKDRVGKTETSVVALTSIKVGSDAQRTEARGAGQYTLAVMGAIVGFIGLALAVVAFVLANGGK